MRFNLVALLAISIALPVSVEIPNSDSTGADGETRVTVAGSMGRYGLIDRGCQGEVLRTHPHEYGEAGLEAVHRFGTGVTMGVRAGTMHETVTTKAPDYSQFPVRDTVTVTEWDNAYVNPTMGYEGSDGGVGVGVVMAREPFVRGPGEGLTVLPSVNVRIGHLDGVHLRASYMESVPLYSGGGYLTLGVGAHIHRRFDTYVGLSGGHFDGPGLAFRGEYRALPNLAIIARTRVGHSGGERQSGFALGLAYVSRPPVPPRDPPESSDNYRSRMWKPEADTLRK